MSKEIGPRERMLRQMREERAERSQALVKLAPLPNEVKTKLKKAIATAAKKRGKPRKKK